MKNGREEAHGAGGKVNVVNERGQLEKKIITYSRSSDNGEWREMERGRKKKASWCRHLNLITWNQGDEEEAYASINWFNLHAQLLLLEYPASTS